MSKYVKMMIVQSILKKAKINTECRIELRKNYSNDAYQSNKAKLTNANFE